VSKKPKPSLASSMATIASIAAQGPARPVTSTLTREHAATLSRENVSAQSREPADTLTHEHAATPPKGFNVRKARVEKPHQSIYAHPEVFRAIRQIAAAEDTKPQDLYREALRLMLAKRGLDFDKLDAGQGGNSVSKM
jgi:hypothetical protein